MTVFALKKKIPTAPLKILHLRFLSAQKNFTKADDNRHQKSTSIPTKIAVAVASIALPRAALPTELVPD